MLVMLKNTINHSWKTKRKNQWSKIVTHQPKTVEN